jgi:hypothetical protein
MFIAANNMDATRITAKNLLRAFFDMALPPRRLNEHPRLWAPLPRHILIRFNQPLLPRWSAVLKPIPGFRPAELIRAAQYMRIRPDLLNTAYDKYIH